MTPGAVNTDAAKTSWTLMVWRLARRELRGGYKGFRVFFLCLLLGVSAIASVGSGRPFSELVHRNLAGDRMPPPRREL